MLGVVVGSLAGGADTAADSLVEVAGSPAEAASTPGASAAGEDTPVAGVVDKGLTGPLVTRGVASCPIARHAAYGAQAGQRFGLGHHGVPVAGGAAGGGGAVAAPPHAEADEGEDGHGSETDADADTDLGTLRESTVRGSRVWDRRDAR